MSWFLGRKSAGESKIRKPPGLEPRGLVSGRHRSPAMAVVTEELARQPPRAILDLGCSSTETVRFLSRYCDQISIQDLFRSTGSARSGARSTVFRFEEAIVRSLPTEGEKFNAVLIWDLLNYFERSHIPRLVAELTARCHPDALVYLLASATEPIPLTPIRFKILDRESLDYFVASDARAAAPQLRTRDIELLMADFEPQQLFQLRNGLQEFVFRFRGRQEPRGQEFSDRQSGS